MKKFLILSFFLLGSFAPHAFAQEQSQYVPLAPISGLTQQDSANSMISSHSFGAFFNQFYEYLIGVAVILAIIMIIYGGLQYATQDSISKKGEGKERIQQAIFGLVLVLSPALVFGIINPSILNFDLSFTPIEQGTPIDPGAGVTGTVDTLSKCTTYGVKGLLQYGVCPTDDAANIWKAQCLTRKANGPVTRNSSGVITSEIAFCAGTEEQNTYEFIQTVSWKIFTSDGAISFLRPLAISATNQSNGKDAREFAAICYKSGASTCISDIPAATWSQDCNPPPSSNIPSDYPTQTFTNRAECYMQTLSCEASSVSGKCASNPGWEVFN